MYYVGIDPGLEGAIAVVRDSGEPYYISKMPVVEYKSAGATKFKYDIPSLVNIFNLIETGFNDFSFCIESQSAAPEQGLVSTCKLCDGYGVLKGLAYSTGKAITLVRPAIWKKDMLAGMAQEKNSSLLIVEKLYKDLIKEVYEDRLDHNIADAVLIAEWGRRQAIRLRKARP